MKEGWQRKFLMIYTGQAFSIIGSAAVQFALVWYLTLKTESAVVLTTSAIIGFLPSAFLGPFAGVWVDRYSRRLIMMLSDGLIAASSVFLAVLYVANGDVSPGVIYVILFVRGIGSTFHAPAMNAAIPSFVPEDQLVKAGGWGSFITSGSNILGPLIGAFLMEMMTLSAVMMVDVAGAAFAIICLLFVKIPEIVKPAEEEPHFLREVKQGFHAIKENRLLLAALPQYVATGIFYFPLSSLFPLLILTHYKGGAVENGLVDTTFAFGMLLSSVVLGIWGGIKRKMMAFSVSVMVMGLCALLMGLLPPAMFAVCLLGTFVMGNTGAWFNVPFNAYIQESTAPQDLGKVISLIITACTIANPVGLAISGPVSEIIGVDQWFLLSGACFVVIGGISLLRTKKPEAAYLLGKGLLNQELIEEE